MSLLLVSLWSVWTSIAPAHSETADRVLVGGRVFTSVRGRWFEEALAMRDGRIIAVGDEDAIRALVAESTEVVELGGRLVIPGIFDAHNHFLAGFLMDGVDLTPATTLEEIQDLVASYAQAHPEVDWISGGQFDFSDLPESELPHRSWLDEVVPDRPVALTCDGPHFAWLNSEALRVARITKSTPDPPGGNIGREEDGEPTGYLEGSAAFLAMRFGDAPATEDLAKYCREGARLALSLGVTGFHGTLSPFELGPILSAKERGEFPLHVVSWTSGLGPGGARAIDEVLRLRKSDAQERGILVHAIKLGLDGMLGGRTAALLEPYADDPTTRGRLRPVDTMQALVKRANEAGISIAVHAVGDAAVRTALDLFESVPKESRRRNTVEHAMVVHPEDLARFAALDVVASMQPSFIPQDIDKRQYFDARLGTERKPHAQPIRSLLEAGAVVAFGTDFNLTPLNPMLGLYGAVARQDVHGEPSAGWIPEQRISLEEALRAATFGPAYAAYEEDRRGTLEVGKVADVVVLSRDPFEGSPAQLLDTKVDLVLMEGNVVYRRDSP